MPCIVIMNTVIWFKITMKNNWLHYWLLTTLSTHTVFPNYQLGHTLYSRDCLLYQGKHSSNWMEVAGPGEIRWRLPRRSSRRTSGSSSFLRESSADGMLLMSEWLQQKQLIPSRRDCMRIAKRRWVSLRVIDPHDPMATYTWIASLVPNQVLTRYKPGTPFPNTNYETNPV